MVEKENYIKFLSELANVLARKISPAITVNSINKLFISYLGIETCDFIIWDNANMQLKDFAKEWKIFSNNDSEKGINYLYRDMALNNGIKFYFNENDFKCSVNKYDLADIQALSEEKNTIHYPMITNSEVFGMIQLIIPNKESFVLDFFETLNAASKLISGAIINYILNEQMEVSLNFYKAMKDIAKIIESQYELSYIIPLIGEMIDRFMSAHLIYIFINKDDKYTLVWPNACKDPNIYKMLDRINIKTEYLLSDNARIGIFPIINEETILGAVVAYSNIETLHQNDIDYLVQLTRQSGMTIQRANMYAEVLKYATMDALTGLSNRRQFEIRMKQEVSNAKRNDISLCGIMLDIDYFKNVNDSYGHFAGDCVLKQVSNLIKNEIREYDVACRYGGEEFFIILPHTTINEASSVAQRLRKIIEDSKMDIREAGLEDTLFIKVTISLGVCAFNQEMDTNTFIQKADKALYEAKETGRNRVIVN